MRRRRTARAARTFEGLEPRLVMATFNVNSLADILSPPAGSVTLRSAIRAANASPASDTINIAIPGTFKVTTVGGGTDNSAGEFAIADSGDLTIQNTSGGTVTINGGGLNRVFDVDPAGSATPFTVAFQGLVITGGVALNGDGGGVDVHGAAGVVLSQCRIVGNIATGDGGGLATEAGATGALSLNGATVSGNSAILGGGIAGLGTGTVAIGAQSVITGNTSNGGGGIYAAGAPLNVVGAIISDNRAVSSTALGSPGGGIENAGNGRVSIAGSLIEGNTADGEGGGYFDSGLAGLDIANSFFLDNITGADGGGVASYSPQVTLTDTTVDGNLAQFGGGVYFFGHTSTARMTDCSIDGNLAAYAGGGIWSNVQKLIVTGTTVADNRGAKGYAGGLTCGTFGDASISDSLIVDNAAGIMGGAIQVLGGTLELGNSRLSGNSATDDGAMEIDNAIVSITGCTIDGNRAAHDAGAIAFDVSAAGSSMIDSTVTGNTAGGSVGGIEVLGNASGVLDLISDTIDGNSAAGSVGGVSLSLATLHVEDTIIAGNTVASSASDFTYSTGEVGDKGGNLLGTTAGDGGKFGAGSLVGDPRLGPLVDNGGPSAGAPATSQVVPTQALLPGSPAFAKGVVGTGIPTTDERGFPRAAKPGIGAYEPQYAADASADQIYVENLYEVLFGRVADPTSLAGSVNFLKGGGKGVTLVQILQGSTEFRDIEAAGLYRRYFDRAASPAEQANLAASLAKSTPEQVAAIFLGTAEFSGDYGTNNDVFVEAVYQDTLGRAASPIERAGWVQLLSQGGTRAGIGTLFVNSTGYLDFLIEAEYPTFLGRMPTPADAANLAKAWPGLTSLQIEAALLGFGEAFAQRT